MNHRPYQRQASAGIKLTIIFGSLCAVVGMGALASITHIAEFRGKTEPYTGIAVDQSLIETIGIAGVILLGGGLFLTIFAKFVIWWQRT